MRDRARRPRGGYSRRLYLLPSASADLTAEALQRPGVETGGILAGFRDNNLGAVVITHASGPGPRATHRRTSFNRDREFCQAYLDDLAARSGGAIDFVGEWHTHPELDPWPSPVDQKTYRSLAANPQCHLREVVVLIAGVSGVKRGRHVLSQINGFLFQSQGFERREIEPLPDDAYGDLLKPEAQSTVVDNSPTDGGEDVGSRTAKS